MTEELRAWVDEKDFVRFRSDVSLHEAEELEAMLQQAFKAGLTKGYRLGLHGSADDGA